MINKAFSMFLISIFVLFCFMSFVSAQTEGIPIQKDVFLGTPIYGPEDLPEEITFKLYDSQDALVPVGSQTFRRGQYNVDFEFSKSDGVTSGNVARVSIEFSQKLNLVDGEGESIQPRELWAALEIAGTEFGSRTKVSDETLVQLLLASDASIATYLTLAYEGDTNPLTTIYQSLPLSSGVSASEYVNTLFSAVSPEDRVVGSTTDPYWEFLNNNIYYPNGNVGIGTGNTVPNRSLSVKGLSTSGSLNQLPTISVANTHDSTTGIWDFSFASFEFSGDDRGVVGEFFADGSGFFLDGTPSVVFRSSTDSPMLLGTNLTTRMILTTSGSVGIATTAATPLAAYTLAVNGKIGCKELTVTDTGWADFVFQDNYKLPALDEVESFISENKHLPGIPSETEVKEKGVSLGDMSAKLLQKVEELTLYVIDLKKENDALKGQLANVQKQLQDKSN